MIYKRTDNHNRKQSAMASQWRHEDGDMRGVDWTQQADVIATWDVAIYPAWWETMKVPHARWRPPSMGNPDEWRHHYVRSWVSSTTSTLSRYPCADVIATWDAAQRVMTWIKVTTWTVDSWARHRHGMSFAWHARSASCASFVGSETRLWPVARWDEACTRSPSVSVALCTSYWRTPAQGPSSGSECMACASCAVDTIRRRWAVASPRSHSWTLTGEARLHINKPHTH